MNMRTQRQGELSGRGIALSPERETWKRWRPPRKPLCRQGSWSTRPEGSSLPDAKGRGARWRPWCSPSAPLAKDHRQRPEGAEWGGLTRPEGALLAPGAVHTFLRQKPQAALSQGCRGHSAPHLAGLTAPPSKPHDRHWASTPRASHAAPEPRCLCSATGLPAEGGGSMSPQPRPWGPQRKKSQGKEGGREGGREEAGKRGPLSLGGLSTGSAKALETVSAQTGTRSATTPLLLRPPRTWRHPSLREQQLHPAGLVPWCGSGRRVQPEMLEPPSARPRTRPRQRSWGWEADRRCPPGQGQPDLRALGSWAPSPPRCPLLLPWPVAEAGGFQKTCGCPGCPRGDAGPAHGEWGHCTHRQHTLGPRTATGAQLSG